jgi:hypothetical protein
MPCTITEEVIEDFFVVKVKNGVEQSVSATFNRLSPTLQSTVFNVVSQLSPTFGPGVQLHSCFGSVMRHLLNHLLLLKKLVCHPVV